VSSLVDRVDRFQRRHRAVGVPLAIVYKYTDDHGPYLAATLTYYSFIAIFPLLLIATSLLGFILQGNPDLERQLLDTALARFPIVGDQLGKPEGLTGSTSAVVVGLLAALYGTIGLGQAAQHALNTAWAVPRNSRLNPITSRFRSLVALVLAGIVVLATSALTIVAGNLDKLGIDLGPVVGWISTLVTVATTAVVLTLLMRYTTSRRPGFRTSLPGGIFIAVGWYVLQKLGGVYVGHVVAKATAMNGIFALVLGLVAFLFLASTVAVLGIELSAVLRRRLYPRALLTPFTDAVELTDADRRAYDSYAKAQRHKGFEHVVVTFDDKVEEEPAEAPDKGR
jgi:inner membrane protein YhjD